MLINMWILFEYYINTMYSFNALHVLITIITIALLYYLYYLFCNISYCLIYYVRWTNKLLNWIEANFSFDLKRNMLSEFKSAIRSKIFMWKTAIWSEMLPLLKTAVAPLSFYIAHNFSFLASPSSSEALPPTLRTADD